MEKIHQDWYLALELGWNSGGPGFIFAEHDRINESC